MWSGRPREPRARPGPGDATGWWRRSGRSWMKQAGGATTHLLDTTQPSMQWRADDDSVTWRYQLRQCRHS